MTIDFGKGNPVYSQEPEVELSVRQKKKVLGEGANAAETIVGGENPMFKKRAKTTAEMIDVKDNVREVKKGAAPSDDLLSLYRSQGSASPLVKLSPAGSTEKRKEDDKGKKKSKEKAQHSTGRAKKSVSGTTQGRWKRHYSMDHGREYFANEATGETTWEAPPASVSAVDEVPAGWKRRYSAEHEKHYYTNDDTQHSVWSLSDIDAAVNEGAEPA